MLLGPIYWPKEIEDTRGTKHKEHPDKNNNDTDKNLGKKIHTKKRSIMVPV